MARAGLGWSHSEAMGAVLLSPFSEALLNMHRKWRVRSSKHPSALFFRGAHTIWLALFHLVVIVFEHEGVRSLHTGPLSVAPGT